MHTFKCAITFLVVYLAAGSVVAADRAVRVDVVLSEQRIAECDLVLVKVVITNTGTVPLARWLVPSGRNGSLRFSAKRPDGEIVFAETINQGEHEVVNAGGQVSLGPGEAFAIYEPLYTQRRRDGQRAGEVSYVFDVPGSWQITTESSWGGLKGYGRAFNAKRCEVGA